MGMKQYRGEYTKKLEDDGLLYIYMGDPDHPDKEIADEARILFVIHPDYARDVGVLLCMPWESQK